MPFGMGGYAQSAVAQGRVYVGGGHAERHIDGSVVMEYSPYSGEWTTLPPYRAYWFAMTVSNNQLVLVGGRERHRASKVLGVWRADRKEWTHPYPAMSTARTSCSAAVHTEWLVVAGGYDDDYHNPSSVEILNTDTKQWYAGPSLPTPCYAMKTIVVGDMYYSMGGTDQGIRVTNRVFSASIPALIGHINSRATMNREPEEQVWKEIPRLPLTGSAPLSIHGSLLAVGGKNQEHRAVTTILLYQPDIEEWVVVGDLPTPRYSCACTRITDREVVVVGGQASADEKLKTVDIGTFLRLS